MRALTVVILLAITRVPASAESVAPPPGTKSENTGLWLAAGGTIASSAFILASFLVHPQEGTVYEPTMYIGVGTSIITPSLGHLYAGQYLTVGMGIRAAAAAAALYGASRKQDQPCATDPTRTLNCPTISGGGLTIISLAAIAYIGGVAYDVRDAPNAVKRHNKRLAEKHGASLTPTRSGVVLVGYF